MNKLIPVILISVILLTFLSFNPVNSDTTYSIVPPPTPAVKTIQTENGTLDTKVYNEKINIVGQGAVHVTSSQALKTIYINSGGITPAGDRFGWFATDSSPNLQNQHFYNFSTGPGITATVGPDDFILSAINFVNATSKICGSGNAVTAFDNDTGVFTCSPFLQTFNGNSSSDQFLIGTANHISVSNFGNVNQVDTLFKINNATCSAGSSFKSYDNKTGNFVCVSGSGQTLDTISNIGTGQASIYAGNTTNTHFTFKTLKQGTGIGLSNNTNDVTISVNFKVNSKTCVSQFFNAFDNSTGVFTCGSVTGFISTINGDGTAAQLITGTANHIKVTDTGATHNIDTLFKVNNATCGSGRFSSYDNKTGNFVCTGGTGGILTSNNDGKGSVSTGVLSSPTSTAIRGKNVTSLRTDLINISSSNNTDINLNSTFKSDSKTCVNQFISAFSNVTGLYTCSSGNSGTVNTFQNIGHGGKGVLSAISGGSLQAKNVTGVSGNTTITSNSTDVTVNLSWYAVVTNGVKQIFAKDLDFGQGFKDTFANGGLYIRNAASTFTYQILGGAILGNYSLTLPPITGADTLTSLAVKNNFTKINKFQNGAIIDGLSTNTTSQKTSSYSLVCTDDYVPIDTSSANLTATLPSAVTCGSGKIFFIKNVGLGVNVLTIKPPSGQTIDHFSGFNMTRNNQSSIIISNGINYDILSSPNVYPNQNIPRGTGSSSTLFTNALNPTSTSTLLMTSGFMRAFPLTVPDNMQFDKEKVEISTASSTTTNTCRIGIYNDGGRNFPTSLVSGSDTGTFDQTAAVKSLSVSPSITLQKGYYWLAVACQTSGTMPTFRALAVGSEMTIGVSQNLGSNSIGSGYSVSFTYTNLPSTFPTSSITILVSNAPLLGLEVNKG